MEIRNIVIASLVMFIAAMSYELMLAKNEASYYKGQASMTRLFFSSAEMLERPYRG